MSRPWSPADIPPQHGKRALVTGANSGIGWHTALELARAGATVTIPARDAAKSENAAARIRAEVPDARLVTGTMDLASFDSVREFAARQIENGTPLDLLVNNAGVMTIPKRTESADGFEMQYATNVLGPFLLTGLLMPSLLRGTAPRVVTVSSYAHRNGGPVPIRDINSDTGYTPMGAYAKSKLANALFARELQRRAGTRLKSLVCHPGGAKTNLAMTNTPLWMRVMTIAISPLTQSAAKGAEPSLFAATSADAKPGGYYGPDGIIMGLSGDVKETRLASIALDEAAAQTLFDELEQVTGIRYAFDGSADLHLVNPIGGAFPTIASAAA